MKGWRTFLAAGAFLALSLGARAQFYQKGTDPGFLHWYSIETPYYQVIYPSGADSLAWNYARLLERFRQRAGYSIGLGPGELQRRKLPVLLHPFNGYANGSVSWAPARMDLYTVMSPSGGDPAPWDVQLAAHEPRHQAQLQIGYTGFLKPLGYLLGEAASPLGFLLYLDLALAEGDAVVAETGFGYGTRARTADFLDYYRLALDQGDFRSWDRWRYGSFKHFTPDYYTLGYLTIGGVRYFYDYPLFTADFLARSRRRPFSFTPRNMQKTAAERAGKPFKAVFSDMLQDLNRQWQEEAAARAPFLPQEQITHKRRFPRSYSSTRLLDGTLYLIREDQARGKELVALKDGRETVLTPLSASVSYISSCPNFRRLYWAETIPDPRWELSHRSVVRYYDIPRHKIADLTREGRLYCPTPSADGLRVMAVEYPPEGGSRLVVLSAADGSVLQSIGVPDGLQATEAAWGEDGCYYFLAISARGTGLYRVSAGGRAETVLEPSVQKAVKLFRNQDHLVWVSDRDGSNEYYRYYPAQDRLVQVTSARYGLTDVAEDNGYLFYTARTLDGFMLFRTPTDSLQPREVSFADVHAHPMEDALEAQEKALGPLPSAEAPVEVSPPKPYRKLPHLMHLHTWLPFYVNYDQIESQSMDFSYKTASPGLTGFFQNNLASMYGYVGYSAHPGEEPGAGWSHSLHGKLTYEGLYPVFEASFDLGGNRAQQYFLKQYNSAAGTSVYTGSSQRKEPLFSLQLNTYVPLRFNKGGYLAGVVPKLSYTFTNNGYSTTTARWGAPEHFFEKLPARYRFLGLQEGENRPVQRLSGSLRGYWMLPVATAGTYPRLGLGLEAGMSLRPGLAQLYAPNLYLYAYGYLPGVRLPQGLRLTALYQQQLNGKSRPFGELYANALPRGFSAATRNRVAQSNPQQYRVTADYAIPIYVGDLSLGPVTYIKNFLLSPHADFTGFPEGNLWSIGADLSARVAHLFFFPFEGSVGVSFSYLGGSYYDRSADGKPVSVGAIFNFDF